MRRTGIGRSGDGASATTPVVRRGGDSGKVSAPLAVEVGADEKETGHAARHEVEGGPPPEQRGVVRPVDPPRGGGGGEKYLQTLIDAEHVGQPLERVGRERGGSGFLPAEERGAGRQAEERHLPGRVEVPLGGDAEERREAGAGEVRRIGRGRR